MKRKVGRPSKKQLRRERNLKIAGFLSVIAIVGILLYGLNNYINKGGLSANTNIKLTNVYDISKATTSVKNQYYTGKEIRPKVTLVLNVNGKQIKISSSLLNVEYKNNINIGQATIVFKGKGKYTGTKQVTFNIINGNTINDNSIILDDRFDELKYGDCSPGPVDFKIVDTTKQTIKSIEYINSKHGWQSVKSTSMKCNGNTCTITLYNSHDELFFRVTRANGQSKIFGAYDICINPIKINDTKITELTNNNKCVSSNLPVSFEDVDGTKLIKIEYKNSKHGWKTIALKNISFNNNKATIKMNNSHNDLYFRVTNSNKKVQTFGPYNVCVGKTSNNTKNYYTITYEGNGGTNVPQNQKYPVNGTTKISNIIPKRDGFKFLRWNVTNLQDEKYYYFTPGEVIPKGIGNITLRAEWVALSNNIVTIYSNGKNLFISNEPDANEWPQEKSKFVNFVGDGEKQFAIARAGNCANDEVPGYDGSDKKNIGYTLSGFKITRGQGKITSQIEKLCGENMIVFYYEPGNYTGDVTLVAQYRKNRVNITFDSNGAQLGKSKSTSWKLNGTTVLHNGSTITHMINYQDALDKNGLANPDSCSQLNLVKNGYKIVKNKEWICTNGCSTKNKVFNANKSYKASDFCDSSKKDCNVVLKANFVKGNPTKVCK